MIGFTSSESHVISSKKQINFSLILLSGWSGGPSVGRLAGWLVGWWYGWLAVLNLVIRKILSSKPEIFWSTFFVHYTWRTFGKCVYSFKVWWRNTTVAASSSLFASNTLVKDDRSLTGNFSLRGSKQAQNSSNLGMKDIPFCSLKTFWPGVSTPTETFSWCTEVPTREFSQPWPWEQVGLFESGRVKTLWRKTFSFLKHMTCRETTHTSTGFSAWPLLDREDPADCIVPLTSAFISTCGSNSHLWCQKVFVSETCCRWVNVPAIHSSV